MADQIIKQEELLRILNLRQVLAEVERTLAQAERRRRIARAKRRRGRARPAALRSRRHLRPQAR